MAHCDTDGVQKKRSCAGMRVQLDGHSLQSD
jgi:hypothetical protein